MESEIICRSAASSTPLVLSEPYAVDVRRYPDGAPLIPHSVVSDHGPPATMLLRPKSMDTFYAAMAWVDALRERGHDAPRLILPYVPGSRQDRLNESGDYLFTLKTIASAINARRFPSVTVLDPHSHVTSALIDRCVVRMPSEFVASNAGMLPFNYTAVIAPDGGAERRASLMARALGVPMLHAWKARDVATGALSGFGIEPVTLAGPFLIVDDICDGGGTFIGLAEQIAATYGSDLDLFVTHGLFTAGTDKLLRLFRRIFTTDSTLSPKHGVVVSPICTTSL